ncbi:hypothetical protein JK359_21635 [Streptomyces actinomycinicus]|uniref:Uncharacterized protein n=1 Tax=Streptomyces actinomycinicus TaxID=1695166 RepID=A0A937JPL8_9ACTN|nr:hypothetical protein [Streptomyces actinomycinicus]
MSVAGCTTVPSGPVPDPDPAHRSSAPVPEVTAPVVPAPAAVPSGTAVLVRTGAGHPEERRPGAVPGRGVEPGHRAAPAAPPRASAPAASARAARHPHPPSRPHGRRPAPRPRPAPRTPATGMRDLCRRADGVAAPDIVRLCHDTFG